MTTAPAVETIARTPTTNDPTLPMARDKDAVTKVAAEARSLGAMGTTRPKLTSTPRTINIGASSKAHEEFVAKETHR